MMMDYIEEAAGTSLCALDGTNCDDKSLAYLEKMKVKSKGEIEMDIPGMGKVMVDASYKKTKKGFIYDWEDYKTSNIKRKIGMLVPHPTKKGKTVVKKYKN